MPKAFEKALGELATSRAPYNAMLEKMLVEAKKSTGLTTEQFVRLFVIDETPMTLTTSQPPAQKDSFTVQANWTYRIRLKTREELALYDAQRR